MKEERCKNCLFWLDLDTIEQFRFGLCRRFPPVLDNEGWPLSDTKFPAISGEEWCGEFTSKEVDMNRCIHNYEPPDDCYEPPDDWDELPTLLEYLRDWVQEEEEAVFCGRKKPTAKLKRAQRLLKHINKALWSETKRGGILRL